MASAVSDATSACLALSERISSSAAVMSISRLLSLVRFSSCFIVSPASSRSRSASFSAVTASFSRHGSKLRFAPASTT